MATAGPLAHGIGTPPDPTRFRDWREYASALAGFFSDQTRVSQGVQPQAVQLIHVDTTEARALEDGLLVFDPDLGAVMVSLSGVWRRVALVP